MYIYWKVYLNFPPCPPMPFGGTNITKNNKNWVETGENVTGEGREEQNRETEVTPGQASTGT
jgi:hypothetical protein